MPDDKRTQGPSDDAPRDPLDDLIYPILNRDVPVESTKSAARPSASNITRHNPLDDLLTNAELHAEVRRTPTTSKSVQDGGGRRVLKSPPVSVFVLAGMFLLLFGMLLGVSGNRMEDIFFVPPAVVSAPASTVSPAKAKATPVEKPTADANEWSQFQRFDPVFEAGKPITVPDEYLRGVNRGKPKRLSAKEVYDVAKKAVVYVAADDGMNADRINTGTGFVISKDGLIVTNFHVVEGAKTAKVLFADGSVLAVEGAVGVDRVADLAMLKVSGTNLSFLNLGDGVLPQVGQNVYALGNPKGRRHTLSTGIVTRETEWTGDNTLIQTNAAISVGSSGGPLLDEYGNVVGVTTGFIPDAQNLNLAVPVWLVRGLLGKQGPVQSLSDAVGVPMQPPVIVR